MAEVFMEYETTIRDDSGREYIARAVGRQCDDGHWEGWLEFVPLDGGVVVRSARETTQPNRVDTEYWATGLTPIFLEGALRRALEPVQIIERIIDRRPVYDTPATDRRLVSVARGSAMAIRARPVLNPFEVYEQGEDILRAQLGALDGPRLRDIIRAFGLSEQDTAELMRVSEAELTDIIVASVRDVAATRGRAGNNVAARSRESGGARAS
jgi:hypothetical protein